MTPDQRYDWSEFTSANLWTIAAAVAPTTIADRIARIAIGDPAAVAATAPTTAGRIRIAAGVAVGDATVAATTAPSRDLATSFRHG